MNDNILLRLLVYFAPLSLLTVGGGQAVVADIHQHVVGEFGWFTDAQFLDMFAVSRMTPGPGTLLVTLIGWKMAAVAGAIVASVAIFVPSSLLVLGLARLWRRYRGAPWQKAIERGLAPVAAGMVLTTAVTLLQAAPGGWIAWLVAGAVTTALMFTRMTPILPVFLGGATYAALFLLGVLT